MSIRLKVEAGAIASSVRESGFSFDPTMIITIALALWNNCHQKQNPGVNPAEMLRGRMDENKNFDQDLLDQARHNAKRANHIAFIRGWSEQRHLTDAELDMISTGAFRHIADADDEVLQACGREASEMVFDDDGGAE